LKSSLFLFTYLFVLNSIFLHQVTKRREQGYAQARWGFWIDACCLFRLRSNRNLGELGFVLFTPILCFMNLEPKKCQTSKYFAHGEVAILVVIIDNVCKQMYLTSTSPNFHLLLPEGREEKELNPFQSFVHKKQN
jgi:hypothetical protein